MLLRRAGPYLVCCRSLGCCSSCQRRFNWYIFLSSKYQSQEQKVFSSVHLLLQSGKNSGNKQTLHFCFKIQCISRLERTTKCCKSDFMYSPDHCPHLIPNDLSLLLQQNNDYTKPEGCWKLHPSSGLKRARRQLTRWSSNLCKLIISKTQTEKNKICKLWSTY